jgi:hypothetical protein
MTYPALIFWALIAWSLTASRGALLVLLLASIPFASLALVPVELTGGMSILPQSMFAIVLILRVVTPEVLALSPKLLEALQLRHFGGLILFLLIGIVATLFMPRLFFGDVTIVPMRENRAADILSPIQANFTQSGYVTLSVMTVLAVMLTADRAQFAKTLLVGCLVGGITTFATGLIDLATSSTGFESLLEPFRNAQYSMTTGQEVSGVRKVIGLAPEASVFGPMCVQFATPLALLRSVYPKGLQRALATIVSIGLIVMAALSTSSAAYVGLSLLGTIYLIHFAMRAIYSQMDNSGLAWEVLAGIAVLAVLLFTALFRKELFDPLFNLIEEQVFNKSLTGSYYERSYWNTVAWQSLASTWGLGIGFGSTRTSNWVAAIASNTGLLGAAFMALFLLQVFLQHARQRSRPFPELLLALKLSLLPALAMATLVSTGPDFGPWMAVVFGAIPGIAALDDRHAIKKTTPDDVSSRTMRRRQHGKSRPSIERRAERPQWRYPTARSDRVSRGPE